MGKPSVSSLWERGLNGLSVEYWLASLKVITIIIFIIVGILVNVGVNTSHSYIGGRYFHLPGAPGGFVGGFGGFAQVFVTASFACEPYFFCQCIWIKNVYRLLDGGTESLGITAGETVNPTKNMPRVVKFVFWRCVCLSFSPKVSLTQLRTESFPFTSWVSSSSGWTVCSFHCMSAIMVSMT